MDEAIDDPNYHGTVDDEGAGEYRAQGKDHPAQSGPSTTQWGDCSGKFWWHVLVVIFSSLVLVKTLPK